MGNGASSCRSASAVVEESESEFLASMEKERREGKALLRKMVAKSDDIDWDAVLAEHAQSLNHTTEAATRNNSKPTDKSRSSDRYWRRRQSQEVLGRRKKYDATGSFSINLLVMTQSEDTDSKSVRSWRRRTCSDVTTKSVLTTSDSMSSDDDDVDYKGYNTTLIHAEVGVDGIMEAEI